MGAGPALGYYYYNTGLPGHADVTVLRRARGESGGDQHWGCDGGAAVEENVDGR